VLPPLKGEQYEVGAKYMPTGRLLLTAAVFDIRESNIPVFDTQIGIESLYKAQAVRHRGLELEATGQIAERWQVKAGVALLDPKVTEDPKNPVNDGETRPWLPKTTANVYTDYEFRNGISVGGGARYVGSVKTYDNSSSPTPDISSYTVFDAAIGYSIDRWRLQLNLKNLFDEHYYVSTPIFQALWAGLYPGEPRSVALSARMDF